MDFPCTELNLNSVFELLRVPENKLEHLVQEVSEPTALKCLENKTVNLDELNYLAKRMESFTKEETDKFFAVVAQENYESLKDMINLTFNMHCYTLIQDMRNMEAIGKNHYLTTHGGIGWTEAEKIDFKEIGKNLLVSNDGRITEYGILYRNSEMELQEVYDGQVFPQYSYTGEELLCVEVGYGVKQEYLYLPDAPTAITKAVTRLGAQSADCCTYKLDSFNADSDVWVKRFEAYLGENDINDVNALAEALNSANIDLEKLDAVIKYTELQSQQSTESIEMIIKLARHINDFIYLPDVSDYKQAAEEYIFNSEDMHISLELTDYFDFRGYGKNLCESNSGKFIDGNFVCMAERKTLEEILDEDIDIKFGGL